jgi:hypothetical protein
MNIRHDTTLGFVAEFSTDFHGDLNAVKTSGFRTTGPPQWTWYTSKLSVLNKLRENRPPSGLTIDENAYQAYIRLSEMEATNAKVREQFAPIAEKQKKAKKERKKQQLKEKTYVTLIIPPKPGELFDFIGMEDLPLLPPYEFKNPIPPHLGPWCTVCQAPVYLYEKQEPPTCLFCEK